MHDVVIIGGGPSGLYAATRLAAAGFDTHLFEEHTVVGTPVHCTGIVAREAFEQFDLPHEVILQELTSVRLFSPGSRSFMFRTESPEAVVVDRRALDEALLRRALSGGVTIHHNSHISVVEINGDSVRLTEAPGRQVAARCCILACGANYSLHRQLGLGLPQVFMQSAQIEIPVGRHDPIEMYFGRSVAPGGFAWVVPFERNEKPYARVGLMANSCAGVFFQKFMKQMTPRWAITDLNPPRRKILPLGPIAKTFASRLVAVGDAAGLVKPMTGGGIYYSLVTAELACEVIVGGFRRGDLGEKSLERYERLWRERLGPELEAQLEFRTLAGELCDSDIDSLFELAEIDGVLPLLRRTARFNHYRRFINELLRHPGAREIFFRTVFH
jgi:geranylgeranyl reductase family protein